MKYTVEEKVIEKNGNSSIKITEQAIFQEKEEVVEVVEAEVPAVEEEEEALLEKHFYHGSGKEKLPVNAEGEGVCTRVPKNGDIVDIYGDKIGFVRNGKMYHCDDEYWAHLVKETRGVVVTERGTPTAYLDANNNILSFDNDYIGTIKEKRKLGFVIATAIACVFIVCALACLGWFVVKGINDKPVFMTFNSENVEGKQTLSEELYVFDNKETKKHGNITPQAGNSVFFEIRNETDKRVYYNITFNVDNMPLVDFDYKLGIDGDLVFGKTGYVDVDKMIFTAPITIEPNSVVEYEFYWVMAGTGVVPTEDFANYFVVVEVEIKDAV
ncbi:MAG: hypothetical protein IJV67_05300 [Clostridia bacterium]|nr:hypothetical protein [Clostridia bacterium]